jgi:trimethylamine--corrinoid protein Co-methyltransferase
MPDYQSSYEKAFRILVAGLSGANTLLYHGSVHGELTHHPIQAILDDDSAGMVGRFMEGITVNDETLAVDLIHEVGPIPGHFLDKAHTRKWWKVEQFLPKAADRLTYPEWMSTGKKTCLDYARERMDEILANHKPTPLTSNQEEEVERVLEEARKHYKERVLITDEEMSTYRKSMQSPNYPYE